MLIRYNNSLNSFDNFFDQVLDGFVTPRDKRAPLFQPAVDVKETPDAYELHADVPGLAAKDIELSFDKGVLKLSGERKELNEENTPTFHRVERRWGRFERQFSLPEDANVEAIEAAYDAGVLTITVPKKPQAQPKQITVKVQ